MNKYEPLLHNLPRNALISVGSIASYDSIAFGGELSGLVIGHQLEDDLVCLHLKFGLNNAVKVILLVMSPTLRFGVEEGQCLNGLACFEHASSVATAWFLLRLCKLYIV